MKSYLLKILTGAAFFMALHFAIIATLRGPIPAAYPVRELIAVKQDMISKATAPRIVFLGGSNVLMGIDAKEVGAACGQPAFNLGLQAGLSLTDLLTAARQVTQAGDTLVLALEPNYYDEDGSWSDWQLRNALSWNRAALDGKSLAEKWRIYLEASTPLMSWDLCNAAIMQHIAPGQFTARIADIRDSNEVMVKRVVSQAKATSYAYSANNIDEYGDAMHTESDHVMFWQAGIPLTQPNSISPYSRNELTLFLDEMKARHVRVFFAHTPYISDSKPGSAWEASEHQFQEALNFLGGELLDRRDALFYPRSYFLDTKLHLNAEGREVRTQMLIQALQAHPAQS